MAKKAPSMARIEGRVEGLKPLLKRLDRIPRRFRSQILRKALMAASKPVLQAAKTKCPKTTGLLRKSLGRRAKIYRKSGVGAVIVGPRRGFKKEVGQKKVRRKGILGLVGFTTTKTIYQNPTKYAHLVEYGTKTARAHPFMRPAWDENRARVEEILKTEIADGIKEAASKG